MKDSKKSRKDKPPPPPEPDIRVVTIGGVEYFIYWEQLHVGGSFFLPTLLSAKDVTRDLRRLQKKLNITLEIRNRCEYGAYGVRIWRML